MIGPRHGALVAWATLLALFFLAPVAHAHAIGVSRGDYWVDGATVHVQIALRGDDAATSLPGLDADRDGHLSAVEVQRGDAAWRALVGAVGLTGDGSPCEGALTGVATDAPGTGDTVRVTADFTCPFRAGAAASRLGLHAGFLDRLPAGHRHFATVHAGANTSDSLLVLARPDFDVDIGSGPHARPHNALSLVRAGVEHILTGWDHLAFLVALVLGCVHGRPREGAGLRVGPVLTLLTAFTVGHSASLAIATLGGLAPASRFVEPAVALSVAYVGLENLRPRPMRGRWRLTLPFGFVHGFAFAGGLLPLGVPRAQLPGALFAFNVGVELGQLAVLAVLLPLLLPARAQPWYPRLTQVASGLIAIVGVIWFVQRVASAISTAA